MKIKLTRQDYLEFNKFVFLKERIYRSSKIAIFFIFIWIILLNYKQPFDLTEIIIELICFTAIWGLMILLIYWFTFNKLKNMPDSDGEILGEKIYIISEEGLKQISVNSETFTKWIGFKFYAETDKYIFLFVDKIAAYIIPKRIFKDQNELLEFTDIVKSKIK